MAIKNLLFLIFVYAQLFAQKENNRSFYSALQNQKGFIVALVLIIAPLIYYIKKKLEEKRKGDEEKETKI